MAANIAPSLNEAVQASKEAWQRDLQSLFDHSKDRFPDVVWELFNENDPSNAEPEEVWGHKAIVYARAPPSFQSRYFSFRPAPIASPMPYYSPNAQSATSFNVDPMSMSYSPLRSPSPIGTMRTQSPVPSTNTAGGGQILRLVTTIASTLFSNELEYLYTGKGFGEAFEFLFESIEQKQEGASEDQRAEKLRKDLVYMWRSRLYSDVRIAITGEFRSMSLPEGETSSAQFSSHRFMLVSRSAYFRSQLLGGFASPSSEGPLTLTLPSPPFTPASLHFVLGYIYTGTLAFSNRTFDLDSAFHILRSATYLSLTSLYNEVQARIVQEMCHGLFHAFLEFSEYETVTGGRFGAGGCRCKTCARRAPRVLEFASSDDVKNALLERGARRALVGVFGEGWVNQEFASLPPKTRESILKGVTKRAQVFNILPMIKAAHQGLLKLDRVQNGKDELWTSASRDAIISGLKNISDALVANATEFFEQPDWLAILESDGSQFEDVEQVEWVMDAVKRGLSEKHGALIYQVLVSAILIRPHPQETNDTLLSAQSRLRQHVEQAREEIIRWLRRRWMAVRQENGFNNLESWALKEISHEIEVPVDDLLSPMPATNGPSRPAARTPVRLRVTEDDSTSMSSFRGGATGKGVAKSNASVHSTASSLKSSVTANTVSTARRSLAPRRSPPAAPAVSKTPSVASTRTPSIISQSGPTVITLTKRTPYRPIAEKASSRPPSRSTSTSSAPAKSPKSVADGLSRSVSNATSKSDATSAFKSARSELSTSSTLAVPRSRRNSGASTTSVKSNASNTPSRIPRSRKNSNASAVSARSASGRSPKSSPASPVPPPPVPRPKSTISIVSTASVRTAKAPTPPPLPSKNNVTRLRPTRPPPAPPISPQSSVSGAQPRIDPDAVSIRTVSEASLLSPDGQKTPVTRLSHKASNDTITAITPQTALRDSSPRGAILNVGIPCIVSSKRAKFRAFARYIGEVEGEAGSWVGVEVPVSDSWDSDKLEGRQWHDGSWGGVRYFDIRSEDWDENEERAARKRRLDNITSMKSDLKGKGTKREGDAISIDRVKRMRSMSPAMSDMSITDTRGLFVRPQQVLYVIDAIGSDI